MGGRTTSTAEGPDPGEEPSPRVAAARAAILDAAQDAIDTVGVRHFRLDDIARRAGCTRQTVANHFGTKDDLLRAFMRERTAVMSEFLFQVMAETGEAERGLREAIPLVMDFLTTRPSLQPPLRADFVAYITTKAVDYHDEQSRILAEGFGRYTDADEGACLLAGQVLSRLLLSYVTQPTADTTREQQIDVIVGCTLLALRS